MTKLFFLFALYRHIFSLSISSHLKLHHGLLHALDVEDERDELLDGLGQLALGSLALQLGNVLAVLSEIQVHGEELARPLLKVVPLAPAIARLVQVEELELRDGVVLLAVLLQLGAADRRAHTAPRPEHVPSVRKKEKSYYNANKKKSFVTPQ